MLLKFSKKYKRRLIQEQHSLVAFLRVETEKSEYMGRKDTGTTWWSVYKYCTSQLLSAEDSKQMSPGAEKRGKKICILHQSMEVVLDNEESSYAMRLAARMKNIVERSNFPILLYYYCDTLESKTINWLQQSMSERTPCVKCLHAIEDRRPWSFIRQGK